MAIKSSDPRKIGESGLDTDHFGRIVADAWMSRHEEETTDGGPWTSANADAGEPTTKPAVHAAEPTHQPFAELKHLLHREH